MSRLIAFLALLVACTGCASAIYKGGRFHDVLHTGVDRSQIHAAMGEAVASGRDPVFNNWPYEDFLLSDPIYNASLAAGASMGAGMTLGLSELVAVPHACWWRCFSRSLKRVRVLYTEDFRYRLHLVSPVSESSRTSLMQNQAHSLDGGIPSVFHIGSRWPTASDEQR